MTAEIFLIKISPIKAERRAELELAQYKQQRHVSTIKFVLFIFCQGMMSQRLRNSSFSEERFPDMKSSVSSRAANAKHVEVGVQKVIFSFQVNWLIFAS